MQSSQVFCGATGGRRPEIRRYLRAAQSIPEPETQSRRIGACVCRCKRWAGTQEVPRRPPNPDPRALSWKPAGSRARQPTSRSASHACKSRMHVSKRKSIHVARSCSSSSGGDGGGANTPTAPWCLRGCRMHASLRVWARRVRACVFVVGSLDVTVPRAAHLRAGGGPARTPRWVCRLSR